jgi:HNH endonuclease
MRARWLKFDPTRFEHETSYLAPDELGVFTRLFIRACWARGRVQDSAVLHHGLGVSRRAWNKFRERLEAEGLIRCVDSKIEVSIFSNSHWGRRSPTRTEREMVMKRYGRACVACGATEDLAVDHIIAVARGGNDHQPNLQVLCRPCNSRKGARQ